MEERWLLAQPLLIYLSGLKDEYGDVEFAKGASPESPTTPQIEPAREAAANLQRLISDQLEETSAITILRHVLFEMVFTWKWSFKRSIYR